MPAQARSNVADLDQPLRALAESERAGAQERKPSSEKIADHATAVIANATSTVLDRLDALQKKLDELRALQLQKMEAAEDAIRAAMSVADNIGQTVGFIDKQINEFRAADARTV
jgi:hypothetical protein